MNIQELATAHVKKIAAKFMALNNQHLGMVMQWEDRFHNRNRGNTYLGKPEERDLIYPDCVTIAKGFGAKRERIYRREQLRPAILSMLEANEPYQLEVVVPENNHVLPFIPAGKTVADLIF